MFNVMVTAGDNLWEAGAYVWDRSRIFVFTDQAIKDQFKALEQQDLEQLLSFPTLFMYERNVEGQPRVGVLKQIQRRGTEFRVIYEFDETVPPFTYEQIQELEWELQLQRYEFTRSHWAVKQGDLYQILHGAGIVQAAPPRPIEEQPANVEVKTNKVFLVHGRDEAAQHKVARFLENSVQVGVVILSERPNAGRHLLTKFEEEAKGADYAVVLMTGDDLAYLRPALLPHGQDRQPESLRARQNVIFELGFFLGKFGQDRVCVLQVPNVERPSDYDGVVYIPFDDQDGWQRKLVTELHKANIVVSSHWWQADVEKQDDE